MRLCNLTMLMADNMPITIQYKGETVRYDSLADLREDYMYYDIVLFRKVVEIWHSQTLYNSIVVVLS